MPESDDDMVAFRLSPRDRAAIQRLVSDGEFRNRSDFLRYAVRSTLDDMRHKGAIRPDLEMESIQLPNNQASHARPRGARGRKGVNL